MTNVVTVPLYAYLPADNRENLRTSPAGLTLLPTGPLGLVWVTRAAWWSPAFMPHVVGGTTRVAVKDATAVRPWLEVQHQWPMEEWMDWELTTGAAPQHWYVSSLPVPVTIG